MSKYNKGGKEYLKKLENDILISLDNIRERHQDNQEDVKDVFNVYKILTEIHNEYSNKWAAVNEIDKEEHKELKMWGES